MLEALLTRRRTALMGALACFGSRTLAEFTQLVATPLN
jgi:hypothetical protein